MINKQLYGDTMKKNNNDMSTINPVYIWLANKNKSLSSGYFSYVNFMKHLCFFNINITDDKIEKVHIGEINNPITRFNKEKISYDKIYKNLIIYNVEDENKNEVSDFFDRKNLIDEYDSGASYKEITIELYVGAERKKHELCINCQLLLNEENNKLYGYFLAVEAKNNKFELSVDDKEIRKEYKQQYIQFKDDMKNDKLTNLPGMSKFNELVYKEIENDRKNKIFKNYKFIYIDVNGFKFFNDSYGFKEGDRFLIYLSNQIRSIFVTKFISRFYDDHFVVCSSDDDVISQVVRLHQAALAYSSDEKLEIKAGIYTMQDYEDDVSGACDKAKLACQHVKNRFDTCYYCYDDSIGQKMRKEHYIVSNIDTALKNGYIEVYYQPIIRNMTGEICSWEALVRWNDPKYGIINPGEFINVLEKARMICKVDVYVINQVIKQYGDRKRNLGDPKPVSINLSRLDFELCDIIGIMDSLRKAYHVPRECIHVEITESILDKDVEFLKGKIKSIQEKGYEVWMDDFGSGYSSFNVLKDYNFDVLKIDMKFLKDFDTNEKSREILVSIVNMAKRLGIGTLAEGVETQAQLDFLRSIGCDRVQGFYYSKPVPYKNTIRMLENKKIAREKNEKVAYYSKLGKINLLSHAPLFNIKEKIYNEMEKSMGIPIAIVEARGNTIRFITANNEFEKMLEMIGQKDSKRMEERYNNDMWESKREIMALALQTKAEGQTKQIDIIENGIMCNFKIDYIDSYDDSNAYLVRVLYVDSELSTLKERMMEADVRFLYSLFACIDSICYEDDRMDNLYLNPVRFHRKSTEGGYRNRMKYVEENLIHEADRKRFREFMELDKLRKRCNKQEKKFIEDMFRIKRGKNKYIWFFIWLIPYSVGNKEFVLACINEVPVIIRNFISGYQKMLGIDLSDVYDDIKLTESEFVKRTEEAYSIYERSFYNRLSIDQEVLRNLLEYSDRGIFWKDTDRRFIDINKKFMEFYNIQSKRDIIGKTDEEMGWHVNPDIAKTDEYRVITEGAVIKNKKINCIVQGSVHDLIIEKRPLYLSGEIVGMIGNFRDVSDSEFGDNNFSTLAITDELTQVLNRRGFGEMLEKYEKEYYRNMADFAIIYIDIDDFKYYNDTFGHQFGDKVLKTVSRILQENHGGRNVIARVGGDEFVIIMKARSMEDVRKLELEIYSEMAEVSEIDSIMCKISVSIGSACYSDSNNISDTIEHADHRMYESKIRKKKIKNSKEKNKE
ncbi:diguanylate cyclase (GGDEF) domain-containing protein [Lachnospiraceae bacterium C7]|nr:diguanylate cyclase (GGDEF) domain-containing protein [Lachnospiraceae bacterium C7]